MAYKSTKNALVRRQQEEQHPHLFDQKPMVLVRHSLLIVSQDSSTRPRRMATQGNSIRACIIPVYIKSKLSVDQMPCFGERRSTRQELAPS